MSKIYKYSETSSIMNISITYGDETFKFNLSTELKIDESTIESDLKDSAQKYAFLRMLHTRLVIKSRDLDRVLKRIKSKRLSLLVSELGAVNKANVAIEKDKKYIQARENLDNVEGQKNQIEVCVRAFEQRTELLRTLAANVRVERSGSN